MVLKILLWLLKLITLRKAGQTLHYYLKLFKINFNNKSHLYFPLPQFLVPRDFIWLWQRELWINHPGNQLGTSFWLGPCTKFLKNLKLSGHLGDSSQLGISWFWLSFMRLSPELGSAMAAQSLRFFLSFKRNKLKQRQQQNTLKLSLATIWIKK